ncbi:MAG: cation:proton antiporter [Dehalococcoidia bacterium]
MEELGLVGNLAVVMAAALVGGSVARILRLPSLVGYLAAGLAIGPNTGLVSDIDEVQTVADLGVALLMFTLGIRFSLRELARVRGLAVFGGLGQIGLMIALGTLLGRALGLATDEALLLGAVVSISSTMVALRLLEDRGELGAPAGRVGVAFALMQDMAVVPLIVMIPVIGGDDVNVLPSLALAGVKAAGLLAGVWIVGTFIVPRVLARVSLAHSRELFLLTVVTLALGTASVSFLAGLTLAFGAFLAGLLVSESEYAHRTLTEVFPLREVFAVVFFVAVGMLIEPASFVNQPEIVFGAAFLGIIGKLVLVGGIAVAFGYSRKAALTAGIALGNMGEFSFVLASEGVSEGVFDAEINEAVLAAVLLSIAISPMLFLGQDRLYRALRSVPGIGVLLEERTEANVPERKALVNHAVVCGFDEAGREVAAVLALRGFRFLVIDQDPVVFRELRAQGVPCILGDPALPSVLLQAELERARVLAVTLLDVSQGESVAVAARQINSHLDIVVRGAEEESHRRLTQAGASEVVHGEFEVGMEFVRHTLHRFGVPSQEVQALLARRRRDFHAET